MKYLLNIFILSGSLLTNFSLAVTISNSVDLAPPSGVHGIYYAPISAGQTTTVTNTANINTQSTNSNGAHGIFIDDIRANTQTNITNTGNITIDPNPNTGGIGIYYLGQNNNQTVTITNDGNITHNIANTPHAYGIDVRVLGDNAKVIINHNGNLVGSFFGILAWDSFNITSGGISEINLGSHSTVDATYGIVAELSDQNTINIATGARLNGDKYAILMRNQGTEAPINTINNAGTITSSEQDIILYNGQPNTASELTFNNLSTGTMTGIIQNYEAKIAVNNQGIWNIRDIVNTKATVSLGNNLNNTIKNTGTIKIINNQADITGLDTFVMNGGILDLTSNNAANTELRLQGNPTRASTFVSHGGVIKMDVVLGDDTSLSDRIYVDQVAGSGTRISINNNAGLGALTTGDGIKLIDVKNASTNNAFTLNQPVTAGAYEYILGQGTNTNQYSWFLRSTLNNKPLYNPAGGLYLMNQYAAVNMFTQNIYDRHNAIRSPDSNLWMRVNHNRLNTDLVKGTQHADIDTSVVQLGADLYHKDSFTLGVYSGYGHSKVDNQSKQTNTKAEGKVDGYHVGIYASWIPQGVGNGPYIDTWTQYAWFDNELKLKGSRNKTYHSSAWRSSIEAGYGLEISQNKLARTWVLEPHAQVIYTQYQADSFRDRSQTRYHSADGNGADTRVGARLYGMTANNIGISPFIEANWLYKGGSDSIKLNQTRMHSGMTKNVAELKVGLAGNITQKLSVWSHIGSQSGSKGFERYEGQVGLAYKW